jgi:hypothetical protein
MRDLYVLTLKEGDTHGLLGDNMVLALNQAAGVALTRYVTEPDIAG